MNATASIESNRAGVEATATLGQTPQKNENIQTNPFSSNRINKTPGAKAISKPGKWLSDGFFKAIIGPETHFSNAHRMIENEAIPEVIK